MPVACGFEGNFEFIRRFIIYIYIFIPRLDITMESVMRYTAALYIMGLPFLYGLSETYFQSKFYL